MAIGGGLGHLMQQPNGENDLNSFIEQFSTWLRKGGTGAPMGRQGFEPPVGTPPRERAGQLRTAAGEGAGAFIQQAGEAAAEPWKPQALDIGLMAATIALPIIAAMQPEGRGRRGQRKQQRMSNLFKGLGELAQKGVGLRMGSFEAGKEATFGAAKTRAEMSVEESQAGYDRTIGGIEAAESKRQWGQEFGLAERRETRLGLPKPGKPLFTAGQLYQQGRNVAADQRREQKEIEKRGYQEADRIWLSLPFATEAEGFKIDDAQSLNDAISRAEYLVTGAPFMSSDYQNVAQQLREIRDRISSQGDQTGLGRGLPQGGASPEEQADFERLKRKYGNQ